MVVKYGVGLHYPHSDLHCMVPSVPYTSLSVNARGDHQPLNISASLVMGGYRVRGFADLS